MVLGQTGGEGMDKGQGVVRRGLGRELGFADLLFVLWPSSFGLILKNYWPENHNRKRTRFFPRNHPRIIRIASVFKNHGNLAILAILVGPSRENCSV